MDEMKDLRWRQRFENFEKSYLLLDKYSHKEINNELKRGGVIQFYVRTIELAWKVLKDYLEAQGYIVKTPRETIKQAFQIEIINDGHIWLDALAKRNITTNTYDDALAKKLLEDITDLYLPELTNLYEKLLKE
ncbi:HI0074 family nucleotidyltransferase substrate-binding subunit [Evansella sp. AB-rgal1]|uniref:HI0074 family nucleotidyltransferase substrate-binding subunit n=1 Tax=Evansella sp. AB-rgal1 TaxID=3242696 RepID=UPI00359E4F38